MKAPKSGHILNAPSCVVAMSWHLILDPGFSEQSLRYQLAKFPVCSSRVSLDVRKSWLDNKEGGERAVVTFDAQRMLGRLESAMGAEWKKQTEAPDYAAGRQLGTLSLS